MRLVPHHILCLCADRGAKDSPIRIQEWNGFSFMATDIEKDYF